MKKYSANHGQATAGRIVLVAVLVLLITVPTQALQSGLRQRSAASSSNLFRRQGSVSSVGILDKSKQWQQQNENNGEIISSPSSGMWNQLENPKNPSSSTRFQLISTLKQKQFQLSQKSKTFASIIVDRAALLRMGQIRIWRSAFVKKVAALTMALFLFLTPLAGSPPAAHAADYFAPPAHSRVVGNPYQQAQAKQEAPQEEIQQEAAPAATATEEAPIEQAAAASTVETPEQVTQEDVTEVAEQEAKTAAPKKKTASTLSSPNLADAAMKRAAKEKAAPAAAASTAAAEAAVAAKIAANAKAAKTSLSRPSDKQIQTAGYIAAAALGTTLGIKYRAGRVGGSSTNTDEDDLADAGLEGFSNFKPDTPLPTDDDDGIGSLGSGVGSSSSGFSSEAAPEDAPQNEAEDGKMTDDSTEPKATLEDEDEWEDYDAGLGGFSNINPDMATDDEEIGGLGSGVGAFSSEPMPEDAAQNEVKDALAQFSVGPEATVEDEDEDDDYESGLEGFSNINPDMPLPTDDDRIGGLGSGAGDSSSGIGALSSAPVPEDVAQKEAKEALTQFSEDPKATEEDEIELADYDSGLEGFSKFKPETTLATDNEGMDNLGSGIGGFSSAPLPDDAAQNEAKDALAQFSAGPEATVEDEDEGADSDSGLEGFSEFKPETTLANVNEGMGSGVGDSSSDVGGLSSAPVPEDIAQKEAKEALTQFSAGPEATVEEEDELADNDSGLEGVSEFKPDKPLPIDDTLTTEPKATVESVSINQVTVSADAKDDEPEEYHNRGFEHFSSLTGYELGYPHDDDDEEEEEGVGTFSGGTFGLKLGGGAGTFSKHRPSKEALTQDDDENVGSSGIGFVKSLLGGTTGGFSKYKPSTELEVTNGEDITEDSKDSSEDSLTEDVDETVGSSRIGFVKSLLGGTTGGFSKHKPSTKLDVTNENKITEDDEDQSEESLTQDVDESVGSTGIGFVKSLLGGTTGGFSKHQPIEVTNREDIAEDNEDDADHHNTGLEGFSEISGHKLGYTDEDEKEELGKNEDEDDAMDVAGVVQENTNGSAKSEGRGWFKGRGVGGVSQHKAEESSEESSVTDDLVTPAETKKGRGVFGVGIGGFSQHKAAEDTATASSDKVVGTADGPSKTGFKLFGKGSIGIGGFSKYQPKDTEEDTLGLPEVDSAIEDLIFGSAVRAEEDTTTNALGDDLPLVNGEPLNGDSLTNGKAHPVYNASSHGQGVAL